LDGDIKGAHILDGPFNIGVSHREGSTFPFGDIFNQEIFLFGEIEVVLVKK